jgi:hypothetical protein
MTQPVATVLAALVSALIGGICASVVTYYLNRRKSDAEVEKIRAETEKLRAETDKLRSELRNLSETVATNLPRREQIVLDGRERLDSFDIRGQEGSFYKRIDGEDRAITPKGEGTLQIEQGGILNIQRTNTEGRFELWVERYVYGGKEYSVLPKNELLAGKRKIVISCEAKVIGGEHSLRFLIRTMTGHRFSDYVKRLTRNEWTPIEAALQADPAQDSQIRIDDEAVSAVPSSVQIRQLFVIERE